MGRVDKILETIDAVLPPEQHPIVGEVHDIILPQLEFIVAHSGFDRVFDHPRGGEWDTHHLFFPRVAYKGRLCKTFRRAFQLPINRGVHEELHAHIDPPEIPDRAVMLGYIAILNNKEDS